MRLVVVYDVMDDGRRRRLHKKLQRLLVPVQYSVFEGDSVDRVLTDVEDLVCRELDLGVDDVRIYRLCEACAGRVRHHGVALPVEDPDVPIVV